MEINNELSSILIKELGVAVDQIPEILNQVIISGFFTSVLGICIDVILLYLFVKARKLVEVTDNDRDSIKILDKYYGEGKAFIYGFIGLILVSFCTISFFVDVRSILQILFTPKVYLLEYLTNLIS